MVDQMDEEWDKWQAAQDEEARKDDPQGLGFFDELEKQYLQKAEDV